MPQLTLLTPFPDATTRLITLLERHRKTFPMLETELQQQQALVSALAEHSRRGEQALDAWRSAISRRWEREVGALRVYSSVQRQLATFYAADQACAQLIAPAHPACTGTPSELLHELRRLEAALDLLAPQPPFAALALRELGAAAAELADAIEETTHCEAKRRSVLGEQRLVANLYERAYDRARRHLVRYLGEQALALPPAYPDAELH